MFHATDALSVIAGVRHTSESKEYTFQRLNPYDTSCPSYTPVGPLNNTTGAIPAAIRTIVRDSSISGRRLS